MPQIGFGHEEEVCLLSVYQIQHTFIMCTVLLYHVIYSPLKFQVSSDYIFVGVTLWTKQVRKPTTDCTSKVLKRRVFFLLSVIFHPTKCFGGKYFSFRVMFLTKLNV